MSLHLLTADTLDAAHALERKAWAFCVAQDNRGGRWSDLYTDGTRFAIVWDDSIAEAFTAEESAPERIVAADGWEILPAPENTLEQQP